MGASTVIHARNKMLDLVSSCLHDVNFISKWNFLLWLLLSTMLPCTLFLFFNVHENLTLLLLSVLCGNSTRRSRIRRMRCDLVKMNLSSLSSSFLVAGVSFTFTLRANLLSSCDFETMFQLHVRIDRFSQ